MAPLMLFMALLSPEGVPLNSHTWLDPLMRVIRWFVSWLTGGSKIIATDLVTFKPLPANVYANGASGAGATLTASGNGALTVDGVLATVGMIIGAWGEAAGANNGLYVVTNPGSASVPYVLTRHTGLDLAAKVVPGTRFGVRSGTVYAGLTYEYTGPSAPTMGTTTLTAVVNTKYSRDVGAVPGSRLPFTVQPTNTNTLTIGAVTYTFVAAIGVVGATTQVFIGANAAATLVNLINAINGDAASKGTGWQEQTVPSTLALFADSITTTLRIRGARSRGGDPIPSVFAATALATTIAGGGAWTNDNLSQIGKADSDTLQSVVTITMTAAMITAMGTAGGLVVELPFTPTIVSWMVKTTAKVARFTITDTIEPVAGGVQLLAAGATHVAATDIVIIYAQQ